MAGCLQKRSGRLCVRMSYVEGSSQDSDSGPLPACMPHRGSPLHRCHSGTSRVFSPPRCALPGSAPSAAARPLVCSHATHLQAHPAPTSGGTSQIRLHPLGKCLPYPTACLVLQAPPWMPQVSAGLCSPMMGLQGSQGVTHDDTVVTSLAKGMYACFRGFAQALQACRTLAGRRIEQKP